MLDKTDDLNTEENKQQPDFEAASQERLATRKDEIETSLQVVSSLTAVDRRFTAAVLMGYNLKDAYLYANPQYEGDNARKLGWQRRQKPEVQAAIDDYFHQKEMTPRRAVALLSEKAEFDLTRYMRFVRDENGRIVDAWVDAEAIRDDGLGHLVKGTKYDKDGRLLFEFEGSLRPLEDVMRYFGLFTDKSESHVTDWRDEVVDLLKNGRITPDDVTDEFGPEVASELIARANLASKGAA